MVVKDQVVVSMNCYASAPTEECCREITADDNIQSDFAVSFCLMTCVLCCTSCDISIEHPDGPSTSPPSQVQERDYPTFSDSFAGTTFTQSKHGLPIPIVYGSDKLTGNVFWSNGFERHDVEIDGKPFYYTTTSFALGICEKEVSGLVRLWLGDQVILDNSASIDEEGLAESGDDGFLSGGFIDVLDQNSPLRNVTSADNRTKITVFSGADTQIPEGIIVEEEGYGSTPAYRGLSFILFENFIVTGNTIPNISVEIVSNTGNQVPRAYGAMPAIDAEQPFDDFHSNIILDLSYNRMYVAASGPGSTKGFAVFNNTTMEFIESIEVQQSHGISFDSDAVYVTSNGMLLITEEAGNGSNIYLLNPFTHSIESEILNTGTSSEALEHGPTGLTRIDATSKLAYARSSNGAPKDIFIGANHLGNYDVAYVEIDPTTNNMELKGWNNSISGLSGRQVTGVVTYTESDAAKTPTFKDGTSIVGTFMFTLSYPSTGFTREEFTVARHEFASNAFGPSITNPSVSNLDSISMNEFRGEGTNHALSNVIVDAVDQTLILFIEEFNNSSEIIAKWDPITEKILWKTSLPFGKELSPFHHSGIQGYINSDKLTILVNNSSEPFMTVDLTTGDIEDLIGLRADQALPDADSLRFTYNSFESSITYIAFNNPPKALTKVFIGKVTRQTVDLSFIIEDLLKRIGIPSELVDISELDSLALHGYTISRISTLRNIFSELAQVFKYDLIESNGKFVYSLRGKTPIRTITRDDMADINNDGWFEEQQENPVARTRKINITYKDIDRDYGANVQSIALPKTDNTIFDIDAAIDVQVPIVLKSEEAKRLAEILLYAKQMYNSSYKMKLGTKHIDLDPSDVVDVSLDNDTTTVRVRDTVIGSDKTIEITATEEDPDIYTDVVNLFGNIGRFDRPETTRIDSRNDPFILAMPYRSLDEAVEGNTNYYFYLTFLNQGHNDVPKNTVTMSINGTDSYTLSPPTGTPTWGYVRTPLLSKTNWHSTDNDSTVVVKMQGKLGATLSSAPSKLDLLNDPELNLCYMGGELVQYETVNNLGDDLYEFTGFHRARMGTDQFVMSHKRGEKFVLLDDQSVLRFDVPVGGSPRKAVQIFANQNNPFAPPSIQFVVPFNLRPWSVANLSAKYVGDDAEISWKRRSRTNENELEDGNDTVDLSSGTESYEIVLYSDPNTFNPYNPDTYLRKELVNTTSYVYNKSDQTSDNFDNSADDLYFLVYQTETITGEDSGVGINGKLLSV